MLEIIPLHTQMLLILILWSHILVLRQQKLEVTAIFLCTERFNAITFFHIFIFRLNSVSGTTKTVSFSNYTKEVQYYKEEKERSTGTWPDIPIAMKEISTVFGKCFFLSTEESATVEQKFQGKTNY